MAFLLSGGVVKGESQGQKERGQRPEEVMQLRGRTRGGKSKTEGLSVLEEGQGQ